MYESFLDNLGQRIHTWSESLWEWMSGGMGGFRMNREIGVNLLSSTDIAWIRYAIGENDVGGAVRQAWVDYLQSRQDERTGRYKYEPRIGVKLSSGHAFWHTVRSLKILESDLKHFPAYLSDIMSVTGLEAYFDSIDWSSSSSNHHEVLGLVPVLVSLNNPEWTEVFYEKLGRQQDEHTGVWPKRRPTNISRTFAYTSLHLAIGRLPKMPEKIIDVILSLQRDDGFWDTGPGFLTMDAAYLLTRLPRRIHHRQAEALAALGRLQTAMDSLIEQRFDAILENTHRTLAVIQTFSLLQEAMPEAYPSQLPWRFDWDKPELYDSATIANGFGKSS